jgi:hypothetical protein
MTKTIMTSRRFSIAYRFLYLGIGVAVFLAAYYIGAAILVISGQDAQTIRDDFTKQTANIDQTGIFLNNVGVGLAMFVPGVGVGVGVYSATVTGMVFNAFAQASPELAATSPLSIFGTGFGILELLAYGLGISRSGMIVAMLVKKEVKREWKRLLLYTGIEVAIVVVALVAGAAVESKAIGNSND